MKFHALLPRSGAVLAGALLAWSSLPRIETVAPAGLLAGAAAPVSYFAQSGSAAIASSLAAGSSHLLLPSSVMPFTAIGGTCSVESSDPGAPPTCSAAVAGGVVQKCSAHCDSQQRCSAFLSSAGGTAARCSTLGGAGPRCSVLQPPLGTIAPSQCSAFGGAPGTTIECSVIAIGQKQICSAMNPSLIGQNLCSTFQNVSSTGGRIECSVLLGGSGVNNKNNCSVGLAVPPGAHPKFCSAHAINSACSVRVGSRGRCTAFASAPAGTCSAYAGVTSFCSVIGGSPGTFCKWP